MTAAALVMGKFYPPHPGHVALIAEALRVRERVVVLCLGSAHDSWPPAARMDALAEDAAAAGIDPGRIAGRAGYDEAPFDLDSEPVWASHAGLFGGYLRGLPPVDLLVTSEAYGPELARRLGLGHHSFDPDRAAQPVSSTVIRSDPVRHWHLLGPGTRAMLACRVVVVGAESTGTTSVSRRLAARLRARGGAWAQTGWVGEYGRELTAAKQDAAPGERPLSVDWDAGDFRQIVEQQSTREEAAARVGGPVLVCDTDAFVTPIWERRYLGAAQACLDAAALGRAAVYLVTDHSGVPFVQDGLRDGEHVRAAMTGQIIDALIEHQRPWALLTGGLAERVDLAERIVDQTVRRRLAFAPPI